MVCDAAIRVQTTSLGVTIQVWHRLGRPSPKGSDHDIGDVGEAKARDRIESENVYTLPKFDAVYSG